MTSRADNRRPTELIRVVDVKFFVPGVGAVTQRYDLGRAEDRLCWSLNTSVVKALQIAVLPVHTVTVPQWMAKHVQRSRAGMNRYAARGVDAARQRAARGAKPGQ